MRAQVFTVETAAAWRRLETGIVPRPNNVQLAERQE
jgi:hypothetical protein